MYSTSAVARMFEDEHGMVDLIIAQAHENELMYVLFPFEKRGQIYSYNQTDKVESYRIGSMRKVILSIQPNRADVADLLVSYF